MKYTRTFGVTVGNREETITLSRNFLGTRVEVKADGSTQTLREPGMQGLLKLDVPFSAYGREFRAVCADTFLGLVQEEQFLPSGRPYENGPEVPFFGWIFLLVCMACSSLTGVVGGILGLLGGFLCLRVCCCTVRPLAYRVFRCVGVVLIVWGISLIALFFE